MNPKKSKKNEGLKNDQANAYTPGLKVKESMVIQRSRILPVPGEILVKKGDRVDFNTIVARMKIPGDPNIVKAALLLRIEPNEIEKCMLKKIGDEVHAGDPIAQYTALFGLIKRTVTSPIEGSVESIGASGWVTIRSPSVSVDMNAYIPGEITEVIPTRGVVIQTNAAIIQGIFGIGGESYGKLNVVVSSTDEELSSEKITTNNKGEILVGGAHASLEALKKAFECGVAGIVVGGFDGADLTKLLGYEIGVAITGEEEIATTLIVTEGFGVMNMSNRTFELLKGFNGHIASISGVTQIRAGVIRPEIIIPHEQAGKGDSEEELSGGMTMGTPIRIIRQPYFGRIGKIASFPIELQTSVTESKVRVVEVELEGNKRVMVPRANVEIIEV